MARGSRDLRRRCRFDHAHPIRGRRSRARSLVTIGLIAATLLALRPLDGDPGSALVPAPAAPVVVRHAPIAPSDAALGPHGDVVPEAGLGAAPIDDVVERRAWRLAPAARLTGYQWPIENARITNAFGPGRDGSFVVDGRSFHDGLDVSSFCGARIRAAHDGVVLSAGRHHEASLGWVGDLGPFRAKLDRRNGWGGQAIVVVVDDGNGYRSVYAHLGKAVVQRGDRLRAGDLLGYEGASGNATGCHLHYSLFSPLETRTITLQGRIAEKTRLPRLLTARIDPLTVLPPLVEARISWGWGAARRIDRADRAGRNRRVGSEPPVAPANEGERGHARERLRERDLLPVTALDREAAPAVGPGVHDREVDRHAARLLGAQATDLGARLRAGFVGRANLCLRAPPRPAQEDAPPAVGHRARDAQPGRRAAGAVGQDVLAARPARGLVEQRVLVKVDVVRQPVTGESSPNRASIAGWKTCPRSRSIARTVRWKYTDWWSSRRPPRKPSSAATPGSYRVMPRSEMNA